MLLWHWLWAIRYPAKATDPPGEWYLPLYEEGLFILATLLILSCLTGDPSKLLNNVRPIANCGLEVDLPGLPGSVVYLIHRDANLGGSVTVKNISSIHGWIVLPSRLFNKPHDEIHIYEGTQDGIRKEKREPIYVEDLIRVARTPADIFASKGFAGACPDNIGAL